MFVPPGTLAYIPSTTPDYICLYHLKVNTPYKLLVNPHWIDNLVFYISKDISDHMFCDCKCLYEFVYIPSKPGKSFCEAFVKLYRYSLSYIANQTENTVFKYIVDKRSLVGVEPGNEKVFKKAIEDGVISFFNLRYEFRTTLLCSDFIKKLDKERYIGNADWDYYVSYLPLFIPDKVKEDKSFRRLAIDFGFFNLL